MRLLCAASLWDYPPKGVPEGEGFGMCSEPIQEVANLAVYLLEDFPEGTKNPYYAGSFQYGRPLKEKAMQVLQNEGEIAFGMPGEIRVRLRPVVMGAACALPGGDSQRKDSWRVCSQTVSQT